MKIMTCAFTRPLFVTRFMHSDTHTKTPLHKPRVISNTMLNAILGQKMKVSGRLESYECIRCSVSSQVTHTINPPKR